MAYFLLIMLWTNQNERYGVAPSDELLECRYVDDNWFGPDDRCYQNEPDMQFSDFVVPEDSSCDGGTSTVDCAQMIVDEQTDFSCDRE